MTKQRQPVSIENTLFSVLAELTLEHAAETTGRKDGYLRALTDPARREQLTVRDLLLLDRAHDAKFNRGYPLLEAVSRALESARGLRFADAAAIGYHAVLVAKENGEAVAALVDASLASGADPKKLEEALRQLEDVDRVTGEAMTTVRAALEHAGVARAPP